MNKKIVLTVFASMCIILLLTQFNADVVAVPRKSLAPHDLIFVEGKSASGVGNPEDSIAKMAYNAVILNQTFDDEMVGDVPKNWTVTQPQYGSFTVDNQTYYSGGKSARFEDNSTVGSPCPHMIFIEQKGTIVVTFAIRPAANRGNNTNLMIYVDDGNFSGSNICFTERCTVEYQDDNGSYVLRNYLNKTWYRIKMIMNIPNNAYDIYINDLLEAKDAKFNKFGTCHEINRIIFGEASSWQPIGHIDEIMIRTSIRVPEDYPTIQEAIDAANPGNTIHISSNSRPYYENVYFENKSDLKLIGENKITTIIDGRFEPNDNVVSIGIESYNITILGFTIKNGNVGIHVDGENNTITDNIVSNNEIGVECFGIKNNATDNRFICNTQQALDYGTLDYTKKRENFWDNGYPTGGNYWSDYNGTDLYSGPHQNETGSDGIGDTPYFILLGNRTMNVDNYPLILIRSVSHNPVNPDYTNKVTISATMLEDIEIDIPPILNWSCGTVWHPKNMTHIPTCEWIATVGPFPYSPIGLVRYKIHVCVFGGVWVVSKTCGFHVDDKDGPEIERVVQIPINVSENQAVRIIANVSEPINASGILKATLYWTSDKKEGNIPMKAINRTVIKGDEIKTMEATIPGQPRRSKVTYYVEAFDSAINPTKSENYSYTVGFASLKTPEILDFMIGEREIKNFTFSIGNEGSSILNWSVSIPDGKWKKWIKSVDPKNGSLEGGKNIDVNVKIDATDLTIKSYYKGKLEVVSNGGNKSIYILLTVTRIIIDRSLVSDHYCDICSNQTICFHAVWGHNFSAVQYGKINVTCIDDATNAETSMIYMTNATGWVSFTNSSSMVGERTWMVTGADCSGITLFKQEAPNPGVIWDKIMIHDGGASAYKVSVTQPVTVWFRAQYEYDNKTFDGTRGELYVNGSAMTWSSSYSRWEKEYSFDTAGNRTFKISGLKDAQEAITVWDDAVGALSIEWVKEGPLWSVPQWTFSMMLTVVAAIGGGIISTLAFWTLRVYKKKS